MENLYFKAKQIAKEFAKDILEEGLINHKTDLWDEDNIDISHIANALSDSQYREILLRQFEQNEKQRAISEFRKRLYRKRLRLIIIKVSSIAAIILLMLGTGLWLYRPTTESTIIQKTNNLLPGKPQATLILANGEKIDLTKATQIQENDKTIITNTPEGSITYQNTTTSNRQILYNTIIVPPAGEYNLTLADGTYIKLNAESELRYPIAFNGEHREVFLKGEAYFEVSKSKKPFIVHAYDANVKVYGTTFNINSYEPEQIDVVLASGKIGVKNSTSKEIILHPNQLARIQPNKEISIKKNINADYYIAWAKGYFAFEEERLEDIMKTLARWYQIDVSFQNIKAKEIRFTASIKKEEKINTLLEQFELTESISFEIKDNQVIIK